MAGLSTSSAEDAPPDRAIATGPEQESCPVFSIAYLCFENCQPFNKMNIDILFVLTNIEVIFHKT